MNANENFNRWLDIFLEEKGIDSEEVMQIDGDMGMNFIPVGSLVESIKSANDNNKSEIKKVLVKIDFANGDVRHFLRHLAKAIAL